MSDDVTLQMDGNSSNELDKPAHMNSEKKMKVPVLLPVLAFS